MPLRLCASQSCLPESMLIVSSYSSKRLDTTQTSSFARLYPHRGSPLLGKRHPWLWIFLVHSVCLKVVLHVLFGLEQLTFDENNTSIITESINSLWIQSKGDAAPVESDKHQLNEALAQVLPEMELSSPRKNPLNLIIPAYESLWRVVLSGFIQVTFVKAASSPTWKSVLAQFLTNPTTKTRMKPVHGPEASAVSVDHIFMEAL